MLIAMAGLPGSGKSTLAARLAAQLGGVVLSKDCVRAALFPPPTLDYSTAEDEIAMDAVYTAAAYIRCTFPQQPILLDGRTFLRSQQVHNLCRVASSLNESPRIIECLCADEIAKQRLEKDLAEGRHPAKNRTCALYFAMKAQAEPICIPHLVLDTGMIALDECVQQCLTYLNEG